MENKIIDPLVVGIKPVMEIMQKDPDRVVKIIIKKNIHFNEKGLLFSIAHKKGIKIQESEAKNLNALLGQQVSHQGLAAVLSKVEPIDLDSLLNIISTAPLPLILALDQIQDQGNLGAIARTAYALGVAGIILTRFETASLSAGAWRSSAGALDKIPFSIAVNLAKALDLAEERDFIIYGSVSEQDCALNTKLENAFTMNWKNPAILILGNENKGIRPGVLKRCSSVVTIPFAREFNSLNIAQAAAILMCLFSRQFLNH